MEVVTPLGPVLGADVAPTTSMLVSEGPGVSCSFCFFPSLSAEEVAKGFPSLPSPEAPCWDSAAVGFWSFPEGLVRLREGRLDPNPLALSLLSTFIVAPPLDAPSLLDASAAPSAADAEGGLSAALLEGDEGPAVAEGLDGEPAVAGGAGAVVCVVGVGVPPPPLVARGCSARRS